MPRGRPIRSIVRQRLAEMLFIVGKMTAYELHKHYLKLFGQASRRNVYYQLEKGTTIGLFAKEEIDEEGEYSWGTSSRKVYYTLNSKEGIVLDTAVRTYFTKVKL